MARVKGVIVYTIGAGYGGYKKTAPVLYLALLFVPGPTMLCAKKPVRHDEQRRVTPRKESGVFKRKIRGTCYVAPLFLLLF